MVTREQKSKMTQFIVDRLEDSCHYDILQRTPSFVRVRGRGVTPGATSYVIAHPIKSEELCRIKEQARQEGALITNILYGDGATYLVKLGDIGELKAKGRSLKAYERTEAREILRLRKLEKILLEHPPRRVLELGENNYFEMPVLSYYIPETTDQVERLGVYWMRKVASDYSHVDQTHKAHGFAVDRVTRTFKEQVEIASIKEDEPASLKRGRASPLEKIFVGPLQFPNIERPFKYLHDIYQREPTPENRRRVMDYLDNLNRQEEVYIRKLFGLDRRR